MLKVLLVDDEEEVRQGIRDKIKWEDYGFEIAGEAENGYEALNIFDDFIPDLVLTDINMPYFDGLELAREINTYYPTVKVVIISGFDDFKFAQSAIKYGVLDYIVKPVLPENINELLTNLKKRIDDERKEKENVEKLKKHYKESLPVLKENFLVSLILGKTSGENIKTRFEDMKIRLMGNWFAAATCKIDSETVKNNNYTDEDIELKRFAVLNIISEILDSKKTGETFIHEDGIVILLEADCENRVVARNRMLSILEAIRQSVSKFMDFTVSIGLGRITSSFDGIAKSYISAITARKYKLILSGDKVIFVEDLEPGIRTFFHLEADKEEELISSIKFKGEKEISECIEMLFENLKKVGASLKEYQLYFVEIISSLMKLTRLFSIDPAEVLPSGSGLKMEIEKFNSVNEAREWIFKLCINLSKSIASRRADESQLLYEKAIDYINKNYGDSELNVRKISDYLYISPSYLNLIFKKKSGKTFLKYLFEVRISIARELLQDPNNKIAYVAEKTGYPDVSYFSYFFKKNTGESPRQFRKNL